MTRFCRTGLLVVAAGLLANFGPAQTQEDTDEATLKNSKLPTDNAGLIDFFEKRSLRDGEEKDLEDLVRKLGSEVFRMRELAFKELVLRGPRALPFLKTALRSPSYETRCQAQKCIERIEETMQLQPISAAARVLAKRNPPKAAEVLYHFVLSVSTDPFLEEEILSTIAKLTVQPGKIDPLVLKALKDPQAYRRGIAAYMVGRRGDIGQRDQLRSMLADADPLVVRRVGEGLIGKRPGQTLQEAVTADDALLREHKIELTEVEVLKYFRNRTLSEKDQARLRALVKDLGREVYAVRQAAHKELLIAGSPALPFLKQVEGQLELRRRADALTSEIASKTNTAVPVAAAHWLARSSAQSNAASEAIRVLLAYIPFADDEMVEDELLTSLTLLSLRDTKIEPDLLKALKDPLAIRRGAAAFVIGQVGGKDDVARAKTVLDDLDPVARLRAAQGMLAARDQAAIPTLVQLVHQAPAAYLNRVEESLYQLAQDKGPSEPIVSAAIEDRKKATKAWEKWLATHQDKIDLTNLNERESYLGLVTICEYDSQIGNINGQVWETNRGSQKRWNFGGVMGAMDAHTLPNGRVLVAENNGNPPRVTERDSKGNILWSYQVPANPICCQRLPNGNTFIASYNMVMEVTPAKSVVYQHTPGPQFYIFSAHKARNGNIVAITAQGQVIEMDSKNGQTVNTVQAQTLGNWCSVEMQPNGNYLVASMSTNNVRELDRKGTQVWSAAFPGVFRATKLPNGNVLVAAMNTRQVAEIDRNGTPRWSVTTAGRPWSVHYR